MYIRYSFLVPLCMYIVHTVHIPGIIVCRYTERIPGIVVNMPYNFQVKFCTYNKCYTVHLTHSVSIEPDNLASGKFVYIPYTFQELVIVHICTK